jgi:hypothetical protein
MPTHKLNNETAIKAALAAADIISGMGYIGTHGTIHLLEIDVQTNTITAILHNLVARQISKLDATWIFHPKGGGTPDLTDKDDMGIQIKVTSDKQVKGNAVSANEGHYVIVKYIRAEYTITIKWILAGQLHSDDWNKPAGTQLAILKKEAQLRLEQVYP